MSFFIFKYLSYMLCLTISKSPDHIANTLLANSALLRIGVPLALSWLAPTNLNTFIIPLKTANVAKATIARLVSDLVFVNCNTVLFTGVRSMAKSQFDYVRLSLC